jgi:hypothetical protein
VFLKISDVVAGSHHVGCQFRRCGGGGAYVAASDIQGLKNSHFPGMSATDSRHYYRVAHLDCMVLDAAMELNFAARKEVCTAGCMTKAASAAVDSASEDLRTNSALVLLAAPVAIVQSVLEVSGTDLDMEEAGNIVAAESAGSAAVESMYYQELRTTAAVEVERGMERALVGEFVSAEHQYSSLLLPLCCRKCFSNDEGKRLGGGETFDI